MGTEICPPWPRENGPPKLSISNIRFCALAHSGEIGSPHFLNGRWSSRQNVLPLFGGDCPGRRASRDVSSYPLSRANREQAARRAGKRAAQAIILERAHAAARGVHRRRVRQSPSRLVSRRGRPGRPRANRAARSRGSVVSGGTTNCTRSPARYVAAAEGWSGWVSLWSGARRGARSAPGPRRSALVSGGVWGRAARPWRRFALPWPELFQLNAIRS